MRFLTGFVLFSFSWAPAAEHKLPASSKTIAWGNYWSERKPALTIASGDTVTIETVSSDADWLEKMGVERKLIPPALYEIDKNFKEEDIGPGGHKLTGPIYIKGASPGDVLEVRIKSIALSVPYAVNTFRPGGGTLPEEFPYARTLIIPLDLERNVAKFAPGIEVPLKPFFGSLGVAPPRNNGRISSGPPWIHAGNLDNKELVPGTTLYIPVHVEGALFQVGDGHAGQGDGEVDGTALETSLNGTFEFHVRKGMKIRWPRAETPTHFITMGFHEDLTVATSTTLRETIDFLVEKGLSRDDAYMLTSIAVDFRITQLVDGKKGVHAMIPKAVFKAGL